MNRVLPALEAIQQHPADAIILADALLDDPDATALERAGASWAKGRALSELDRVEPAIAILGDALDLAHAGALSALAADIRISLSACLLTKGDTAAALDQLRAAEPEARSRASRGRLVAQHGFVAMHLGELDAAVGHLDAAEPFLAGEDELARARLLINRGMVRSLAGDLDQAAADLTDGRVLADRLGQRMMSAGAAHNLGYVHDCRGELPTALRWFGRARSSYEAIGSPRRVMAILELDLASALLNGGLHAEAAAAAERAAVMAASASNRLVEAEALLLAARARLARDDSATAAELARRAAELFARTDRRPWASMAAYVGLQAEARAGDLDNEMLARAVELAEQLGVNGWRREATDARIFAGRTALALGRVGEARRLLAPASATRESGSALQRAGAWLATASLHLADGRRDEAKEALGSGMRVVEEHRATFGSTELRAFASLNAAELMEQGLRLATEDGDPNEIMTWAERWHAGALQLQAVRPGAATRLSEARIELRRAYSQARQGGDPDGTGAEAAEATIARLEREVRDLSRAGQPFEGTGVAGAALDDVWPALGAKLLVEFFTVGEEIHLVTADRRGVQRAEQVASVVDIEAEVLKMTAAISRLAYARTTPAAMAATVAALDATSGALDQLLFGRLDLPPAPGLVVVPTGPLQGLPWCCLPSLRAAPLTIAPSARLWAAPRPSGATASDREVADCRVLLVCSPELRGGSAEIERLRKVYPGATALVDGQATVQAVLDAMEQADIVHLAAHGELRTDNPMFSSIQLADGPLTVYDVEALSAAPRLVILSACDAGRSSVKHGDELLGTAAAMLQTGVRTVVAPLSVIPDVDVVPSLMEALHRELLAGATPARALHQARCRTADSPRARAIASSFVAIGSCCEPA